MNKKEYIICAAIWFKDDQFHEHQPKNIKTGFVVTGRRHHNCFATCFALNNGVINTNLKSLEQVQGFLTNTDKFVDRVEAVEIAFQAGQIEEKVTRLISEDLY